MAEEPKITYLFGAGASAQALPTIKGLPESILEVHDYIKDNYTYKDEELTVQNNVFKAEDAKQLLLTMLLELYNTSIKYSTIDTYAKQLYLNDSDDYDKLIFSLGIYFSIKQKITNRDSRYETFFISILDNSVDYFPSNIKFLSWNYDVQMEYAYDKIAERNDLFRSFRYFNKKNIKQEEFSNVKINGSAVYYDKFSERGSWVRNPFSDKPLLGDIEFILTYCYLRFHNHDRRTYPGRSGITYSWHCDKDQLSVWTTLHSNTEYLVVIGYSFPFFNREVDRAIIRGMPNLKKIYIQDLYPENIVSRFLSILPDYKSRDIEIIPVNNVDEFFLPPEL